MQDSFFFVINKSNYSKDDNDFDCIDDDEILAWRGGGYANGFIVINIIDYCTRRSLSTGPEENNNNTNIIIISSQ